MNRKPRVLFILPLPPPVHGSSMVGSQIRDSAVLRESFDCDFVSISTSRLMSEIGRGGLDKICRFLAAFFKTLCLLLTHRYSLCYLAITCHGGGFIKDAPFVLLCKICGRKVVIHQHNKGMSSDVERWPYKWLLPLVYRKTTVILLSWRLYPDIQQIVSREQVCICPNGIPDSSYRSSFDDRSPAHILFLSNLIESKGVFVLLDALKLLHDTGSVFVCDMVGAETAEIDSKRFGLEVKARGLEDIVLYHGKKVGADKTAFFDNADIFAFPTFYNNECFPLVLLEAMQFCLPVVTTDEGGIPDMVIDGETGLICKRQDPVSLADCLKRLLDDRRLRNKMGECGRKRYQELYTEQVFENRLCQILLEAIIK